MQNKQSSLIKNFDEIYSDVLIHNASVHTPSLDFTLNQPIFTSLPPIFIKNILSFSLGLSSELKLTSSFERHLSFFSCLDDAIKTFDHLKIVRCLPTFIAENLCNDVIIDLGDFGVVAVTSNTVLNERKNTAVLNQLVSPIITYIFSNELWMPNGKWPRLQAKLELIFESKNLLQTKGNKSLGIIQLNPIAQQRLEKHGYSGETTDSSFNLYLPWTFSSRDLTSIDQIISREF